MNTYLFVAAAVSAGLAVSAFADKSCGISCDLGKLVAEDLSHEVRPGDVGGSPFWNLLEQALTESADERKTVFMDELPFSCVTLPRLATMP